MSQSDEPSSPAAQLPADTAGTNGWTQRPSEIAPVSDLGFKAWMLTLAAGLAAGVIAWALAKTMLAPFRGTNLRVYDYTGKTATSTSKTNLEGAQTQGSGGICMIGIFLFA